MAATTCRLAAAPLVLAPLPRRPTTVAFAVAATGIKYGLRASRGVAIRAADGTGSETEVPEVVKAAQDAWAKVEDKYAVTAIGVAALVGLWTAIGAMASGHCHRRHQDMMLNFIFLAIDRLPLLPGVLELVGIGYTGWFTYRNLIFQPDREALVSKIKSTYNEITGSSS
uniref:Cyanobacterial aminoacyl-tRNA synthetase CAAD domain-containing protein n=1 Tax=Oryza rufipogon TaxID=4529 RepID=A0A0E0Q7Z6_ORYRU